MHYNMDPYHLGITFLVNLEIAYLAPPLGLNLIISSFRFERPVTEVYRAVLPFIGVLAVTLLITTYIPELSTFLPSLSKTKDLTNEERGAPDVGEQPGGEQDLDDLEGPTLDDLNGPTLDDLDGPTLDDLDKPSGDKAEDLDNLNLDDLDKQLKPDQPASDRPTREDNAGAP
jgi:hypothetical protein